jgi:hypothetical protein
VLLLLFLFSALSRTINTFLRRIVDKCRVAPRGRTRKGRFPLSDAVSSGVGTCGRVGCFLCGRGAGAIIRAFLLAAFPFDADLDG